MHLTFYGAVREVTGSMHLLSTDNDRILFDCGMYQGRRKESERKNRVLPFDPRIITNIILSHAHIDHSGRIPLITKGDFHGRILSTTATEDVCEYLFKDSAKIQESDSDYLNYKSVRRYISHLKPSSGQDRISPSEVKKIKKLLKKGRNELNKVVIKDLIKKHNLEMVTPLYTTEDAMEALGFFEAQPYNHEFTIGTGMTCKFYEAGHILGSAISIVKAKENGRTYNICYSGDFGRFEKPILKDPTLVFDEEDREIDLLIMESTYGNRFHEPVKDQTNRLAMIINETYERGGSVLIPSFAFGRTQELIYVLHELYNSGDVPKIPVYVDSPLATNITKVFGEHPEVYDKETHQTFLENGENPFSFKQINFTSSVEESMALMRDENAKIIIASSGMCEAGRILHHLRYSIHNKRNTILIVGYMAGNTLGRKILEKGTEYEKSGRTGDPPIVKILNKEYPLNAHVVKLGGFSAHGDRNELMRLIKDSNLKVKKIAIVHGEEDQALSFQNFLKNEGFQAVVPHVGETIKI